ncbi:hypothetical protein ZBT109_0782 [Zymobacter palmae]|uniref:Uncharacterized protein n=1 Tax=Zymobacter palmae TaxID=33074 RepID=A0A348HD56_9GAMM|nr:hypothetical protein ZBT109_0782 [Zymobacter palmae]
MAGPLIVMRRVLYGHGSSVKMPGSILLNDKDLSVADH